MSKARNFQPLIHLIEELKPATEEEKDRIVGRWDGAFLEWNKKNETSANLNKHALQNFPVKRLRLITNAASTEALLDVTYTTDEAKSQRKQVLKIPSEKLQEFKDCVDQADIEPRNYSMLKQRFMPKLNWRDLKIYYVSSVIEDYKILHDHMLKQFESQLTAYLKKHPNVPTINLVDAGCGQAPTLLKRMYEIAMRLKPKNTVVKALGFDFVEKNVAECVRESKSKSYPEELKFVQGDSTQIERIIKENKDFDHSAAAMTAVFFSGSMTRMTLQNAFEAVRAVHGNWRALSQFVEASGETDLLFSERMLKRMGYHIKMYTPPSVDDRIVNPVFGLERIPASQMLLSIKNKLQKKPDKIDLSLNPSPETILESIIATEPSLARQVKKIDLSFTDLHDSKALGVLLQSFSSLEEIVFNYNDSEKANILIQSLPPGVKLTARYTQNELVLFGSRPFFQRMGQLKEVDAEEEKNQSFNNFVQQVAEAYRADNSVESGSLLQSLNLIAKCIKKHPELYEKEHARLIEMASDPAALEQYIQVYSIAPQKELKNALQTFNLQMSQTITPDIFPLFQCLKHGSFSDISQENKELLKKHGNNLLDVLFQNIMHSDSIESYEDNVELFDVLLKLRVIENQDSALQEYLSSFVKKSPNLEDSLIISVIDLLLKQGGKLNESHIQGLSGSETGSLGQLVLLEAVDCEPYVKALQNFIETKMKAKSSTLDEVATILAEEKGSNAEKLYLASFKLNQWLISEVNLAQNKQIRGAFFKHQLSSDCAELFDWLKNTNKIYKDDYKLKLPATRPVPVIKTRLKATPSVPIENQRAAIAHRVLVRQRKFFSSHELKTIKEAKRRADVTKSVANAQRNRAHSRNSSNSRRTKNPQYFVKKRGI